MQVKHISEESTLALKPMAKVKNRGVSGPTKGTDVLQFFLQKNWTVLTYMLIPVGSFVNTFLTCRRSLRLL